MINKIILTVSLLTLLTPGLVVSFNSNAINYNTVPNLSANVSNPSRYFANTAAAVSAINAARLQDSSVKNKAFALPTNFNDLSVSELTFWYLNNERSSRGLLPMGNMSNRINTLARTYAVSLADAGAFTHTLNGTTPWSRMDSDIALKNCREFNPRMESLYKFSSMGLNISDNLKVLHGIYTFLYNDASSSWGHREHMLVNYNNNFGSVANEGFIGAGLSNKLRLGWSETYFVIETLDPKDTCTLNLVN